MKEAEKRALSRIKNVKCEALLTLNPGRYLNGVDPLSADAADIKKWIV